MRRQAVTRDQVFEAADQIVDMGLNPTQHAIIRQVGGSYSTVGKYMEEWRRHRRAANENPVAAAPDQLLGSTRTLVEEIWSTAMGMATVTLREDQRRLEAEHAVLDQDRIYMLDLMRSMEETAAMQEERIATLERSSREAEMQSANLKGKLAQAQERASVTEVRLAEADKRVAELLGQVRLAHQHNADLLHSLLSLREGWHPSASRRTKP
jgi:chromosome segregation ATPase